MCAGASYWMWVLKIPIFRLGELTLGKKERGCFTFDAPGWAVLLRNIVVCVRGAKDPGSAGLAARSVNLAE